MSEAETKRRAAELIRTSENWAIDEVKDAWQRYFCGLDHKLTCEVCQSLVATPFCWMALKARRVRCDKHVCAE